MHKQRHHRCTTVLESKKYMLVKENYTMTATDRSQILNVKQFSKSSLNPKLIPYIQRDKASCEPKIIQIHKFDCSSKFNVSL